MRKNYCNKLRGENMILQRVKKTKTRIQTNPCRLRLKELFLLSKVQHDILRRTHKIHAATEVNARGRDKTGRLPRKIRTLGKSKLSMALVRNANLCSYFYTHKRFHIHRVPHRFTNFVHRRRNLSIFGNWEG